MDLKTKYASKEGINASEIAKHIWKTCISYSILHTFQDEHKDFFIIILNQSHQSVMPLLCMQQKCKFEQSMKYEAAKSYRLAKF